jgi:hypothetical protein
MGRTGVTSFTVIYHCMKIQQAAKAETGVACEGSNQCAYQLPSMLISLSCPYKYQLNLMKRPRPTAPSDAPAGTVRVGGEIEWFSLALHVTADTLLPEQVTDLLGAPTISQTAGVPRQRRDGSPAPAAKFGRWTRELKRVDTDEWGVAEAVRLLFDGLPEAPERWSEVRALGTVQVSVGLSLTSSSQEFLLDEELVQFLAERRASVWVDVYGDEHEA